jgi:hypothetical protein
VNKDHYAAFSPRAETPLVVDFLSLAAESGVTSRTDFGFWDFLGSRGPIDRYMVVKTVKNRVTPALLKRVLSEKAPVKILLAEGRNPQIAGDDPRRLFLASTGTGLYVRDVGWVTMPGKPMAGSTEDIDLKLSRRWRKSSSGVWMKRCRKCGLERPPECFYRSSEPSSRDPYRSSCKDCARASRKSRPT